MKIEISKSIIISDYDSKLERFLHENYTIPNPEYIKRVKLNLWHGRTPKTLNLWTVTQTGKISIAYGTMREVIGFILKNYDRREIEVVMALNDFRAADWTGNDIKLRPYQQKAVDHMLSRKFGILKAPCSSGKTIMGHALAKATGQRTLWITHTKDLLNQSLEIGKKMLPLDKIGTITDGNIQPGDTITYATIQTLAKTPKKWWNMFDCVIVDECHRCNTKEAASQMSMVVNNICATYKYGLSATPETFDGYARTVLCNLGNIEYIIEKDELEATGTIMPVVIKPINTYWKYPEEAWRPNGTVDFALAVKYLICDELRNDIIVGLIVDKPTLVLSNNIDHLVYIMNRLSPEQQKRACLICTKHDESIVTAKDVQRSHTAKAREEYLEKMRNGELDIMFATYQLAKEGLNIPRLEQVIMAFPAVDQNIITQTVGRVARTCEGKSEAVCYDLVDKPAYFQKQFANRKKLYKKQGNVIE